MRHVYVRGMISAIWLIVAAASGVSGKPKDAARYAVLCIFVFVFHIYSLEKGKKRRQEEGN